LVTKIFGNYNIIDNVLHFTDAPIGNVPFVGQSTNPDEQDYIGIRTSSSFSGRVFLRSAAPDTLYEPYKNNYIFDDISNQFDGFRKTFELKSNGSNVSGISSDNAILLINNIFQGPVSVGVDGDYDLSENSGITSVTFTGSEISNSYDVNTSSIPRGGIILSIGSTSGFGYQPLVSAGGTAVVSLSGTIQSISIGNSGSGYRSGVQSIINVGVRTDNLENSSIEFIGTASVINGSVVSIAITNPGVGYTISNPPSVIFDPPLSYSNIPLVYSSKSTTGFGTGANIDIVVGQGSSVVSFEIKNLGYGYNIGEILTVSIGGTTGIQTTSSPSFSEFQIIVDQIYSDQLAAWVVGNLQVIDPLDSLFNGQRTVFPILIEGNQTTIRSEKLPRQEVQSALLVFINDILQVPGQGYIFNGGSTITFTEAPKEGDTSKILFYKGTADVDTRVVDILETIKIGDSVTLKSDNISLEQDDRLVTEIISSDSVETNLYSGSGISQDLNLLRPVLWCRQTEDLFINNQPIGKDRIIYEPYIQPVSNIIQNVGVDSTVIFTESVKTFFDSEKEYIRDGITEKPQNKILIISQDNLVSAEATSVVSSSGTISSVVITDGGVGYTTSPTVSIQNSLDYLISSSGNVGINTTLITGINTSNIAIGYEIFEPLSVVSAGTTISSIGIGSIAISIETLNTEVKNNVNFKIGLGITALAVSSISIGGTVSSISITNPGSGYSTSNPPIVLIEPPQPKYEIIDNISYSGDFGVITGIKTTTVGVASTGIIFDLFIPLSSPLRDGKSVTVGVATTGISGIQTGYYFVINKSNVGKGITSLNSSGGVVGIGTTFIDNIYQVAAVSIAQTAVPGVGITYVSKVTVSISDYNGLSGLGFSGFYGEYSWGRIYTPIRIDPQQFTSYANVGGISTSPIVQRYNRLKYIGYSTS
jgi:hypothetical protein